MTDLPSLPLFVDDYEAATAHLSLEEDGAYSRLIRLCWRTPGCSIPVDTSWIIRHMRCDTETYHRVVFPVLSEFFTRNRSRWFQKRLREEHAYVTDIVGKRRAAGRKGGTAKALKYKKNVSSKPTILPEQNSSKAVAPTPTPTPRDTVGTIVPPVSIGGGGGVAREASNPTFRERIILAMGKPADSRTVGSPTEMLEAQRWITDLGLSEDEVVGVVQASSAASIARGDPPSAFRYFTKAMQRNAAAKREGALQPAAVAPRTTPVITIPAGGLTNGNRADKARFDVAHREYARRVADGEVDPGPDPSDPFPER